MDSVDIIGDALWLEMDQDTRLDVCYFGSEVNDLTSLRPDEVLWLR